MITGDRFWFIRHAETEWNQKKLCQGIRDIPLSPSGKEKTLKFGQQSKSLPIETICSSPLLRALETATCIHQFHPGASLKIIDDLKERDWGKLEGISSDKMYEIEEQEEANPNFYPGNGIEPRLDFQSRITKGINNSFQFSSNPFIVSHGRVFLSLCEILNIPTLRQIPNLSVAEFSKTKTNWTCKILAF